MLKVPITAAVDNIKCSLLPIALSTLRVKYTDGILSSFVEKI